MVKEMIKIPSGQAGTQREIRPLTLRQKFQIAKAEVRRKKQIAFAEKLQKLRAKRLKAKGKFQLTQAVSKERAAIRSIKAQRAGLRQARFRQLTQPTILRAKKARGFAGRGFRKVKRARRSSSDGGLTLGGGGGGGGLSI